jgi:hypothetical protein
VSRTPLRAAAGAALFACALLAPAAQAARVALTSKAGCYHRGDTIAYAGSGFRAGARFRAAFDGKVVDAGRADEKGRVEGAFAAPRTLASAGERSAYLVVSDGTRRAARGVRLTAVTAGFSPPRSLRVAFHAYGFGPRRNVYLHYLRPDRRVRATVLLGRTTGPCGRLLTAQRALFPFRVTSGNWRLQFDRVRRYKATARPSVRLVVPVRRTG